MSRRAERWGSEQLGAWLVGAYRLATSRRSSLYAVLGDRWSSEDEARSVIARARRAVRAILRAGNRRAVRDALAARLVGSRAVAGGLPIDAAGLTLEERALSLLATDFLADA